MNPRALSLLFTLLVSGCTCDGPNRGPAAGSSASASAPVVASSAPAAPARVPRPTHESPKPESFDVKTPDGVVVHASLWRGGDANAPAVVLAHRLGGERTEWTPLIERLFPPKKPMTVVALDLRGHGASTTRRAKPAKFGWQSFETRDFERMEDDVTGVLAWLGKRADGAPSRLILVGSDIGGTAVVRAASASAAPVAGVALVSPGASLRGVDLYEPFGAVLALPNLIIAAESDNVSSVPAKALGAMSKSSSVLRFAGNAHGAEALGAQHWEVWDSLADWVEERVAATDPSPPAASASAPGAESAAPPAAPLVK